MAEEDEIMHVSIATKYSLSIVVGVAVVVSNIEALSVATGLKQRVHFALLQNFKLFRTSVNKISLNIMNVFLYSCLLINHAKRMHHIILSSVICLVLSYYSTLSRKLHDFREEIFEYKIRVFLFPIFFV